MDLAESRKFIVETPGIVTEQVPFTIRVARSDADFDKAVQMRHEAYGRHVPAVAEKLRSLEAYDRQPGTVVLVAESKLDGSPLGTMRIHTSRFGPLPLEGSVELPAELRDAPRSEANRLGITNGRIGRLVKLMLFKAYYRYCLATGIDWMVIAARSPLDRQYEALLFTDLFDGQYFPMRHGGNIPHRVLGLRVATAERRWAVAGHALYDFMGRTFHPDIELDAEPSASSLPGVTAAPRELAAA
ncbi:MAG: hypothetical protein N2544_13120 [Burkholderiales bacterium]|nr:hypothetical protein [Burkholderiales bacterium]